MFAIVFKDPRTTWYVPEAFDGIGAYPETPDKAKKFPDEESARAYMHEHHYDTNQWNRWLVIPI